MIVLICLLIVLPFFVLAGKYSAALCDQHAANMLLNAMLRKMIQTDLALAYEYQGRLYATYSKAVPGLGSTEELHGLNLDQNTWDSMRRVMVWAESGKIYE